MSPDLQSAIERVAQIMPADRDDWWIIGSAAMALAGLDIAPADVDVFGPSDLLSDVIATIGLAPMPPKPDGRFRSTPYARLNLPDALPIEFMGGLEVCGSQGWVPLTISSQCKIPVGNSRVHIPDVAEQILILQRFGRPKDLERAALLTRFTMG